MKFPHCRKRQDAEPPAERSAPSEATLARMRAERALAQTRAQTPFYRALGARLRVLQERNHIAENFEHAFQKGKTT